MDQTIAEILSFIEENDIKFIKLQFCDVCGELKSISIMSSQLERAFLHGISFDASSIKGFLNIEESDLFLFPDPSTLAILPWRPQEGRVARFFCDIKTPDGDIFKGDCRNILKKAVQDLWNLGYTTKVGPECEFYLFKTDDEGDPILVPHDGAGYFEVAPFDKGENIRREICLTLEEMGVTPESSHHESGPGQNEIDFMHDNALISADNFITYKNVIKTIANLNGLHASFMPKPLLNKSGSGLHINLSISKEDKNLFHTDGAHNKVAEGFIAGVMDRIKEITAVLNPTVNSYKRFGSFEAPKYVTWSHKNRSQLIRIPASRGEYSRMELRSPDSTCNPYIAFALLIYAGMEGIKEGKVLPEAVEGNLYGDIDNIEVEKFDKLPSNLNESLHIMKNSEFVKKVLGDFVYNKYLAIKSKEWQDYESKCTIHDEISEWEINNYFYRL
ncbi:type I glutamate--ammonia ligase [Clostridium sp. SHJSY1]|uniref:type I glutamate--ammonia ligase n=1 Tax=Clostridium sp. SHJSY1 TaxID=2942483 RepID=UPI0028761D30|nr:type I glutamate--ammonia ligase [Clostridium sp. SHJSY1]MDS0526372.1 type I glutamate--ammonia ligase [Clostridium sp. SHJSY1]